MIYARYSVLPKLAIRNRGHYEGTQQLKLANPEEGGLRAEIKNWRWPVPDASSTG